MTVEYIYQKGSEDYNDQKAIYLNLKIDYPNFNTEDIIKEIEQLKKEQTIVEYELELIKSYNIEEVENFENFEKYLKNKIEELNQEKQSIKNIHKKESDNENLKSKLLNEIKKIEEEDFSILNNSDKIISRKFDDEVKSIKEDFISFEDIKRKQNVKNIIDIDNNIEHKFNGKIYDYNDIQNEYSDYNYQIKREKTNLKSSLIERRQDLISKINKLEKKYNDILEDENLEPNIKRINKIILNLKSKYEDGKKQKDKFLLKQRKLLETERVKTKKQIENTILVFEERKQILNNQLKFNNESIIDYKIIDRLLKTGNKTFIEKSRDNITHKNFYAIIIGIFTDKNGNDTSIKEIHHNYLSLLKSKFTTNLRNITISDYQNEKKSTKIQEVRISKRKIKEKTKKLEELKKTPFSKIVKTIKSIFGTKQYVSNKVNKGKEVIKDIENSIKKKFSTFFTFNGDDIDKELKKEIDAIKSKYKN